MKRLNLLILVALVCLVPTLASAGEQANAPTVTGETGLFTLLTGETLPQGSWSFGLYYNNWDRLVDMSSLLCPGCEVSGDWNRLGASFGYGITDRWEVSVLAPYDDVEGDSDDIPGFNSDAKGMGNIRVGTKFRLMGNPGDFGTSKLALSLFVQAPTGDKEVASDKAGYGAGIGWSRGNWAFDAGYRDPGDNGDINVDEELHAGIGHSIALSDRLDWITELEGIFYSGGDIGYEDVVDLTTGGRLWLGETGNWALNFGLRTDLTQLDQIDEHCPIGGLLGLTFFPRFHEPVPPPPPPPPAPAPAPEPEPTPAPAPPPPPPPPPAPAPRPEERITVSFTPGSARLSNIAKAKLDEVALRMKQDPELRALVIGYTDPSGSADGNQRTSEQRAEAVKSYLVTRHGIDPNRITTEGRGSQDSTGDPEQDRRAVVILSVG
jgi:outer membrane protein OmpA-like peptidoglycan-associated protein